MSDPSPAPSETVERPDPGLARGRWEAPPWAFYATLVAVALGTLAWLTITLRRRRSAR